MVAGPLFGEPAARRVPAGHAGARCDDDVVIEFGNDPGVRTAPLGVVSRAVVGVVTASSAR